MRHDLEIIESRKFAKGEIVIVDGKCFVNCSFLGCTLRFGGDNFSFDDCEIENTPIEVFGKARNTIRFVQFVRSFSPGFAFELFGPDEPDGPTQ